MKFRVTIYASLWWILICPCLLIGQVSQPAAAPASSSAAEEHYPDQGLLSPTRYTNQYFGFAFDLPAEAGLQPIPQPAAADSRIQLLQLGGPPPADAVISIAAIPIDGRRIADAKALLRKQLDQELFVGVEELHGLSKTTLAGHQFYWYETRRGIEQHVMMATNLNSYVVAVLLGSHSDKILKQLQSSFQQIVFFPPSQVRQYAGGDAQEYEGPAISAHRLAQLKADPPAGHIDPGMMRGNMYENRLLGFSYRIPQDWIQEKQGAIEPAVERVAEKRDLFEPSTGRVEQELQKLCSRTLFSVWARPPGSDGQIAYDDFGEVTVSAAPASCFPGIKFPTDSHDRDAVKDFLLQFSLTHPVLREMRDAKTFSSGGNVFIFLHGTVALSVPDDKLSRRLSMGISITQRRGYLLTWFFAAPHDTEMKDLLEQRVNFEPETPARDATATHPGGGEDAAATEVSAATQPVSTGAPASDAGKQNAPSNASATASQAASAGPTTGEPPDVSSKPTLLRPGETMPDQQVGGKPVPRH